MEWLKIMDIIFPTSPKMAYNLIKRPLWNTHIKRTASGKEMRSSLYSTPLWEFEFPYYGLHDSDVDIVLGFVNVLKGAFDTFYFKDPLGSFTNQIIGTGDGVTTDFQLSRSLNYWYIEYPYFPPFPVTGYGEGGSDYGGVGYGIPIWETPFVYLDGVEQGTAGGGWFVDGWFDDTILGWFMSDEYTISQNGLISFESAPDNGVVVTASWDFYYRTRFKEDSINMECFSYDVWKSDGIVLVSVK